MNDILKQRLVGALILVALGVVFWPIIFVEPGDEAAEQQARIPPRPGVAVEPLAVPDLAGLRGSPDRQVAQDTAAVETAVLPDPEPEPQPETEPEPEPETEPEPEPETEPSAPKNNLPPAAAVAAEPAARTRSESPEKLAMDADGIPIAWILQVASVSSADKADELRQRLLQVDKKAYVKRVKRGGKDLYRVYIGPKFERAKLEAMQSDIDARFGVKSMIARYLP